MKMNEKMNGEIAVVYIDDAPLNTLSIGRGVVSTILSNLKSQLARDDVGAVVVRGRGKCFSAGADIADFDKSPEKIGELRELIEFTARARKPVVMAIHGYAMGGGLELALAGHARIATADATFAFPEVTLGLLPGGGGTQRLPRLVGPSRALELILTGKRINAQEALACGLIDAVVDDIDKADLADAIRTLPLRVVHELHVGEDVEAIEKARAEASRQRTLSTARDDIIKCIAAAAAEGAFEDGLALEARFFDALLASDASAGLRHSFFAARQAAVIPGMERGLPAPTIDHCAVIGAGTMGAGIALALLNAGLTVVLVEQREQALTAAVDRIAKMVWRDVEKGRCGEPDAVERLRRLTPTQAFQDIAKADLVIEAVFEDMDVKREVFTAIDRVAKPTAILASNTSTLDIDAMAAFSRWPERVVGLHFFSPANVMRLVEVVRGARTAPVVLAASMAFAKRIGKIGVVAGVCDGFIGNRIFEEYLRQAYFLIEEGALPQQVDRALEAWGMAMGPFRTMDLAGQDIGWSIRKRRALSQPDRPYSKLPDLICELGRYGQKTKAGFYLYPDGRTPKVDPEIDALVVAHSAAIDVERRDISDAEIVDRCVLAMVNEGARILGERIAYRPLDIDVVYLNGYGFPAERGGPMFYAERRGLHEVYRRITELSASRHGWAWQPAPLLAQLVDQGRSFSSLNPG